LNKSRHSEQTTAEASIPSRRHSGQTTAGSATRNPWFRSVNGNRKQGALQNSALPRVATGLIYGLDFGSAPGAPLPAPRSLLIPTTESRKTAGRGVFILLLAVLLAATLTLFPAVGQAEESSGVALDSFGLDEWSAESENPTTYPQRDRRLLIGVTYPGVTVGYQGERFGAEMRGFASGDVVLYGPRFTHYPFAYEGGNIYWGADIFYISEFEGDLTEGDGWMAGGFFGLQHYFGRRFSFNIDTGPYYIELEDDLSGGAVEADDWKFIMNASVNFHF